ncbi:MAG: HAMP domain-containing protein [Deltaproteobacteria bacterium]|nr:HAMP domain-containing protein [Deltaproteobacteria bacterium]
MKLYHQLILFVLAATAIPLLVGFVILRHNEGQLEERLLSSRAESATRLAEVVQREMKEVFERIQDALGYASIEDMSDEELTGLLGILYKQSEDIIQVALLNQAGDELIPGVYLDHPERYPEYAGRLSVSKKEHAHFVSQLPLEKSNTVAPGSVVLGIPHLIERHASIGISFVVPRLLASGKKRWLAVVELSLEPIIRRVLETGDTRGWSAKLVDEQGKVIADPERDKIIARVDQSGLEVMARMQATPQGAFFEKDSLTAFAVVPQLDWGVVITQSRFEALSEVRTTRRITVIWTSISILALLLLGGLFTGRITKNLRQLLSTAEEFSKGNLDSRVAVHSKDEVGLLSRTFNRMGEDLKASREEIEAWNRELAQRVEERTRELKIASERLLETSKLAAIGQLGAGVAHEINNPLVGILGNVQILINKFDGPEKQVEMLSKIESAAKRCREVTQNLLRFSEQEEDSEHVEVNLRQVLEDAYSLTEQQLQDQDITTNWKIESENKVIGDHRQLMRVFLNLFANARTAMNKGGNLTIAMRLTGEGMVRVDISDTGKGIDAGQLDRIFEPFFTTKDVWTNTGLGLSVAYRVVSDHGGQISVESEPGSGSVFSVLLPANGVAV